MSIWKRLFKVLPKKKIYIEGSVNREEQAETEILEGEIGPIKVTFDKNCEYEIVEREIKPAKLTCAQCGAVVLSGMDFCNRCGAEQKK